MTKSAKKLIIPSAKLITESLQVDFGKIPTAMIPLKGKPVLSYIERRFKDLCQEIIVGGYEFVDIISEYIQTRGYNNITLVNVGDTKTLGETILKLLQESLPASYVYINFADTVVMDQMPDNDFIFYSEVVEFRRWTELCFDESGKIYKINDKSIEKENIDFEQKKVFVGLFGITNPVKFLEILQFYVENHSLKNSTDPFYQAIQEYFNKLPTQLKEFIYAKDWRDFGHLDTYYESKKNFYLDSRSFNSMQFYKNKGIICKRSTNKEKLIDEILWYQKLPKQLQFYIPRIFNYDLNYFEPFVEMEYYGYPTLSDIYLFGNYDIGTWNSVFSSLKYLFKEFTQYKTYENSEGSIYRSLKIMYIEKTKDRISKLINKPEFKNFVDNNVKINGIKVLGLKAVIENLEILVESFDLLNLKEFSIIHGDLCFTNILYDVKNKIVRLVDPRGRFGDYDIYGDPRYDLAKLCHSINGDYDFILNGHFRIEEKCDQIVLTIFKKKQHIIIRKMFYDYFLSSWKEYQHTIHFIESLLFLSMVPLHTDKPIEYQKAFLSKGLSLLDEVLKISGVYKCIC